MIIEAALQQIRRGESLHSEFQIDANNLENLAKTVCGFLNTQGGTIFCGVDVGGEVVGIPNAKEREGAVQKYLMDGISPKALFTVNRDSDGDVEILSIEVPEGKDRPYVFDGRVFVRQATQTRMANAETLREIVRIQAVVAERWERRPSVGFELEDIDFAEVRRTAEEARQNGRFAFTRGNDEVGFLRELAVYGARGFTQAGDVLFAKSPARRHPQTRVRLTRFDSNKGGGFDKDRLIEGPAVQILEEAFNFLSENVTQTGIRPGDLRRSEGPRYPLNALREGLVNAFAHRDYSAFSGGVSVGVYPDRVEIWNSGRFPSEVKPGDLSRSHPSVPTNPDIAHVMYLRNLMERVGRGGQLIVSACKAYNLPAPKWTDKPAGVTLTFFAAASVDVGSELNNRQQALLRSLSIGQGVTVSEYLQLYGLGMTDRQARRDLVGLEDKRLVTRKGAGPTTRYVRTEVPWGDGK